MTQEPRPFSESELRKHGTKLLRLIADRLCDGVTTGHDWPNTQDELTKLQGARLLREAAAELEGLREWAKLAFRALNNVGGVLLIAAESEHETAAEIDGIERLRELCEAAASQYPPIAGVRYQDAYADANAAAGIAA